MKKNCFLILAIFLSMALASSALAWTEATYSDTNNSYTLGEEGTGMGGVKRSPNVQIAYNPAGTEGTEYILGCIATQGTRAYGAQFNVEAIYQSADWTLTGGTTEDIDIPTETFGWDDTNWPSMMGGQAKPTS